jgi:hypothetical protein
LSDKYLWHCNDSFYVYIKKEKKKKRVVTDNPLIDLNFLGLVRLLSEVFGLGVAILAIFAEKHDEAWKV